MAEVGKRLIGHLSKGYQQRTGLAQAIVHTPPVIILDEPTIGLDPIQIQGIRTLIRELAESRASFYPPRSEVQSTCTHVHILRAGRLVHAGALAELEQQRPSASLRIGLNAPPPVAELEQLPRVTQVEELGEGQFRLHHSPARYCTGFWWNWPMTTAGICGN